MYRTSVSFFLHTIIRSIPVECEPMLTTKALTKFLMFSCHKTNELNKECAKAGACKLFWPQFESPLERAIVLYAYAYV